LKDSQADEGTLARYEQELRQIMHLLKIKYDGQIARTAFELIKKSNDLIITIQHGGWINALNAIAGSYILSQRVLSQSEIYDFLTVAVTTSIRGRTKVIDDMIFRIYRDIMAYYESSDNKLKIAYPKIIADIVAILVKGVDTRGNKIPLHNLEYYYQMRKSDITTTSAIASEVRITTATPSSVKNIEMDVKKREETISSDYKKQQQLYKEDEESELVEILNKMTDRNKKDIQESIAKLDRRDIERIKDLCKNYSKLQKYSKLISDTDELQTFKISLQNEIGKKLSDHQLQHAANSIRKAKLYLENILDGKFMGLIILNTT
jgi:hypothetical protein